MGRRGHGEGSIFQRSNGLWVAEIDLGRGPDGKRRRRTIYGKTRKEVIEAKKKAEAELTTTGRLVDPSRMTLGDFLAQWLDTITHSLRPATVESYRQCARVHILPTIGTQPLRDLQPIHLQQLYNSIIESGRSRRTAEYVHAVLRRSLGSAVKLGLILRNPCDAVDAPRPSRRDMTILTQEQVAQLLTASQGDPLHAFIVLAVATGARRGELVALRWADVDLTRPAITINRTAELVGQRIIWTEPKTASSRRTIPLPAQAVTVLRFHRAQQAEERLAAGESYQDQDLVFARPDGRPLSPGHISQHFNLLLRKAGLPHIRLHDLRHTHATMLLQAGVHPKIVSERLGHSSITITLDTYSHVIPTMQDAVARTLTEILPAAVEKRSRL